MLNFASASKAANQRPRRIPMAAPPNMATPVKRSKTSELHILIAAHFQALRTSRRAEKKLAALIAKHPDLEHRRPFVEIYTRGDGEKIFGRWVDDFNKIFPSSMDNISRGNPRLREAFIKRAKEAQPGHSKRREAVGIEQAEEIAIDTSGEVNRAFNRLKGYSPSTIADMRLLVRHIIKTLPEHTGGPIFQMPSADEKRGAWWNRRSSAFFDIEVLLRSLAREPRA